MKSTKIQSIRLIRKARLSFLFLCGIVPKASNSITYLADSLQLRAEGFQDDDLINLSWIEQWNYEFRGLSDSN